ncbi:MAG TPA: three-Cys-motif partner protein TcmP [Gemmatimonadales bacterium]|jgi:three-Cys-motif partner protein
MERVSDSRRHSPLRVAESPDSDAPLPVNDDGLCTPFIKAHSLEKIRVHNRFARMFATSMRDKWDTSYIGLYAGPGHARIAGSDLVVQTSALSVLRQPQLFNHYVFVEKSPSCVKALSARWRRVAPTANVHIIPKDVHDSITDVRYYLPKKRLLGFCFVDPFSAELQFRSTIGALTDLRIDFLVLLMLGNDARRNFKQYFNDPNDNRIADLVDRPDWRADYRRDGKPVRFILNSFTEAMQRRGYPVVSPLPIYAAGTKVLQYMLTYYSKDAFGLELWHKCIKSLRRLDSQGQLFE